MANAAAREAETWRQVFSAADAYSARPIHTMHAAADAMTSYLEETQAPVRPTASDLGFWTFAVGAALSRMLELFEEPETHLPISYAYVDQVMCSFSSERQLAVAIFHVAAFPLVAAMIRDAHRRIAGEPGHALAQRRNVAALQAGLRSPIADKAQIIHPTPDGLKEVVAGLRSGRIVRLALLPDGPVRPGTRRACTVPGIGGGLLFGGRMLGLCFRFNVPVLPMRHVLSRDGLIIHTAPVVRPSESETEADFIATVLGFLGLILAEHPEQWLNWAASAVRR